jgi:hypothetical protein
MRAKKVEAALAPDEPQEVAGQIKIDLLSERDSWASQSLRLAYVVDQVNDATLRKFLVEDKINQVKVLDNWITAAQLFDKNAELLTRAAERAAFILKLEKLR